MPITIKEFSVKYGVPYSVVYNASFGCTCYNGRRRSKQYDEHELFLKTVEAVKSSLRRYHDKADEFIGYLDRLQNP